MTIVNETVVGCVGAWLESAAGWRRDVIAPNWVAEGSYLGGYRAGTAHTRPIHLSPSGLSQIRHKCHVEKPNYHPGWKGTSSTTPNPGIRPDKRWSIAMRSMVVAAVATVSLGIGAARAQGLPPNMWPSENRPQAGFQQSPHEGTVFLGPGTVFAKIFGRSNSGQTAVSRTADRNTTSAGNS